jgi:hypothetical protein
MEINRTIYMTYKKPVPEIVYNRWKTRNPKYNIELSLDAECILFLEERINRFVAALFNYIPRGMYKADLWRLCKLYINGGVYADVDLVPHLKIDNLSKDITFYSCLTPRTKSIFQAFMVNFSKPKNNLILIFLLSFLINKPFEKINGPTFDMYDCIKYNLDGVDPEPFVRYDLEEVKIKIDIGSSDKNVKIINLYYFPPYIKYRIQLNENTTGDKFTYRIYNNILFVKRLDANSGWDYEHSLDICIQSKESIFLFKEDWEGEDWVHASVTLGPKKILDSRDINYHRNRGW